MSDKNDAAHLVVIHHQDPPSPQIGIGQEFSRFGNALAQACRKPEGAALAVFAFHPHIAAHEIGQFLGDGQPQPGAAVLPRCGGVGLLEGLEQLADLFLRQADARVPDGKAEKAVLVRFFNDLDGNDDLALFGELDGIVGIIDQDLSQPQRVAHEIIGSSLLDMEHQLQPFCGCFLGNEVGDILQDLLQLKFRMFDRQLARLDLREIEDVVDDAEQMLSRLLDLLDVVALLPVQCPSSWPGWKSR